MTKFIYRVFNTITLTFILGVLTGLIVNTYTGSAENESYDRATICFFFALLLNVGLTVIQGEIKSALEKRISSNNDLEPGQFRAPFQVMVNDSIHDKSYYKYCLHIFSYLMIVFTVSAVLFFHQGNEQANRDSDIHNAAILKQLGEMETDEKSLSGKLDSLANKIANLKTAVINSHGIKKSVKKTSKVY